MNKKKITILFVISIIVISFVSAIVIGRYKEKKKELNDLVAYNDSISLISHYTDSINNENRLKFEAKVLIGELQNYDNSEWKKRGFREDWDKALLEMGFEKQQEEILLATDCSEYDDELYNVYGIQYVRNVNDRVITITQDYICYTRTQDGVYIAEEKRHKVADNSMSVEFSSKDDYDKFILHGQP